MALPVYQNNSIDNNGNDKLIRCICTLIFGTLSLTFRPSSLHKSSPTPPPRTGSSDHVPRSIDVCGRRAKHFGFLFRHLHLSITGCLTSAADKITVHTNVNEGVTSTRKSKRTLYPCPRSHEHGSLSIRIPAIYGVVNLLYNGRNSRHWWEEWGHTPISRACCPVLSNPRSWSLPVHFIS
jgi:hypothetical protein